MLPRRPIGQYDVALIPCSSSKNPGGMTARSLYRGATFSLNARHAALTARDTLIMSAKYGLLKMDSPVRFYDSYLPDLQPGERADLLKLLRAQMGILQGRTFISYLPKAYFDALTEVAPWLPDHCARPFKSLPNAYMRSTLSREIKAWPRTSC